MTRTGDGDTTSRLSHAQDLVAGVARQLAALQLHDFRNARTTLVACISTLTATVLPELNSVVKEENFRTNNVAKEKATLP